MRRINLSWFTSEPQPSHKQATLTSHEAKEDKEHGIEEAERQRYDVLVEDCARKEYGELRQRYVLLAEYLKSKSKWLWRGGGWRFQKAKGHVRCKHPGKCRHKASRVPQCSRFGRSSRRSSSSTSPKKIKSTSRSMSPSGSRTLEAYLVEHAVPKSQHFRKGVHPTVQKRVKHLSSKIIRNRVGCSKRARALRHNSYLWRSEVRQATCNLVWTGRSSAAIDAPCWSDEIRECKTVGKHSKCKKWRQ